MSVLNSTINCLVDNNTTDVVSWNIEDTNRNDTDLIKTKTIWILLDFSLILIILVGNTLTLVSVYFNRKLQDVISNQFIISLAISDIIVGVTLGYHLAFYLDPYLSVNKTTCLLRFAFISFAFTMTFDNLVAVALDRYIAIKYPLYYVTMLTHKYAIKMISVGWVMAIIYGAMPLIWNIWSPCKPCEFWQIKPIWYIRYVLTPSITLPWLIMVILYMIIWHETYKLAKRLRENVGSKAKKNWKSVQLVLLILGSFSVTWIPYLSVIVLQTFTKVDLAYKITFLLAMANSGINPLIYAWKNAEFRRSFMSLIRCRNPSKSSNNSSRKSYITDYNRTSITQRNNSVKSMNQISLNSNGHENKAYKNTEVEQYF